MIVRGLGAQAFRHCARRPVASRVTIRRFSAPSSNLVDAPAATAHPLVGVTTQFDHVAPRFEIEPSQINILDSPSSFYETIKDKIRNAKRRIYLSTLYIGKTEHELVRTIDEALEKNRHLRVSILTDALRGTRETPDPSSASLLTQLVAKHGDRVQVSMFHTPKLTGWKKKYIPRRINEGWGLQHMKLYGFDDEIMLSGANLSNDYFTNRLDRYHVFSSKELTDYYWRIHEAVCDLSYRVLPTKDRQEGYILESPIHRGLPDPVWHPRKFKSYAKHVLEPLIHKNARQTMFPVTFSKDKTFVYPVAQFDALLGPAKKLDIGQYAFSTYTSTELPCLSKLLKALSDDERLSHASWVFTAGYFNIHPDVSRLLIGATPKSETPVLTNGDVKKPCTVITASPWANGFYGSAGISGMLPAAYTLLSRRFLRQASKAGKESAIDFKEWRRGTVGEPGGWTYHAKGIWVTLPSAHDVEGKVIDETGPSITLVGSSNYTKRSYSLDLEIGAMIVTGNEALKRRLREETEWLQEDAKTITQDDLMRVDRRVGLRVRLAMWLVERLGGAL